MREMKDSGIEWIEEIPEDWSVCRFKNVSQLFTGNSIKDTDKMNYEDATKARPYLATKDIDVIFSTANYDNGLYVKYNDFSFKVAPEGSTLMCIEGGSAGRKKTKLTQDVSFVNKLCCFKSEIVSGDYLYYFLCSPNYESEFANNLSGLIGGVSTSVLKNIPFLLPPPELQNRIADYLDNKCVKIDSIIEREQAVIEKLKAYKLSVITEAVTKGLNPDVPMKDSRIEWIGEIPEHWDILQLRYVGSCQNGISKGGSFFGSGLPFVSYSDVYKNYELPKIGSGLIESTRIERDNYSVQRGDIFFTRTSETIEEVGLTSVCMSTMENATFAGFLIRVRPKQGIIEPQFSKYYFRSEHHRRFIVKEMNLVTRASLGQELLKRLPVLLPPIDEQKSIAVYLEQKSNGIDSAIVKTQTIIDKLTEYKKSLIYEVVTGKKEV